MDNSFQFILDQQKIDKRIKVLKNKKNKGALYSRYIGQKVALSKYSVFVDCDDIILKDGKFQSYSHIIKHNLDVVQFLTVIQTQNLIAIKTSTFNYNRIIYKPILPYIFYYDFSVKGAKLNVVLWDKLVKTKIINKAFEFIGYSYLKKNIIIHNDQILSFSIFQMANSYHHIDTVGYFYIENIENSTHNSWRNSKKKIKLSIAYY